ncbi:MAG: putative oxidoreductase [Pseudohongiellaceae bacterium]|jgi:putative oxidoreductase
MKFNKIKGVLAGEQTWSPVVVRLIVGSVFVAHGAQKLFAWFGGYGLEGTGQYMASIGLEPGYAMAIMAGSVEFFGGLALLLGLLVRPAALGLAATMLVAIFTAHFSSGFFLSQGGYEYALTLFGVSVLLVAQGAGRLSLDAVLFRKV